MKPLINAINEESMNTNDYNECIKCIENLTNLELKNEALILPLTANNPNKKEQYNLVWIELESWLKHYENMSDRHKVLYDFVNNKLKQKSINVSNELTDKSAINNKRTIHATTKEEIVLNRNTNENT